MKHLALVFIFILVCSALLADTIISANITNSTTWNLAGSPYIITGNYIIYGSANPILSIEPGVVIKFNANTSLMIGHNNSAVPGGMLVNGTAENPVLFTANSATPSPGFWNCVRTNLYASPDNVVFNHAIFEYGGSGNGLFDVNGANPQFFNCSFRHSAAYGLHHSSTSASAQIQNCSFAYNGGYPFSWNPNLVPNIGSGNTFVDNNPNRILLKEIYITQGVTFTDYGIPYEASGHLYLRNGVNPLILEPNTQLLFRSGKNLYVGNSSSSSYSGSLSASNVSFGEAVSGAGWNGIDFQHYSHPSALNGCTISNIGNAQSGGVYVRSQNLVSIRNCAFGYIDNYALCVADGYQLLYIGNTISNCSKTISVYAKDVHKIGSGNVYQFNTDNRIHCLGGTVSESASWTTQQVPIFVNNNITFYGNDLPVLVIPYATVLEFAGGKSFSVGTVSSPSLTGTLRATGVTFRGTEAVAGHWIGLIMQVYSGNSMLSGCIIKDAGYNNAAALQFNVTNSAVTGCTIYNCAALGINLSAGSMVNLSGTVIFLCGSYPLSIGANSLRVLGANNSFTGNTIDRIQVRNETISQSGNWRNAGVPYYFTNSMSIYGDTPFPHIKILPGVVILFPDEVSLTIGTPSSPSLLGSLEAEGVTFTRSSDVDVPNGLLFNPYTVSERCLLTNCSFEYMQHTSQNCAVYVNGSAPVFSACSFANNPGGAIVATVTARPSVLNCSFVNNGGYPLKTSAAAFDVVSGVGNYFSGNNPNRILISGGNLNQDYTWDNPSVPVELSSDITVYGNTAPVLRINSGLNLLFQNGVGIAIGTTSSPSLTGGIQAEGASFSALSGIMGGWDGLTVNFYSISTSYLRNCIFQHGAANGNIFVNNAPLASIESCIIRYGNIGIKLTGSNSAPSIVRNYILANQKGIYCASGAHPLVGGALGDANSIEGNSNFGLHTLTTNTINAEYNWWGDEQGPTVRVGDTISGNVDYDPWRSTNIGDAPSRFHLLSPATAALIQSLQPVLDWEEAIDPSPDDVLSYTLELAQNPGFSLGLIVTSGLLSTVYHIPAGTLTDDTRYYWRVKVTDLQGQESTCYEAYSYFDTAVPDYPAAFHTLCPALDESVMLTSNLLSWQAALDPDPGDQVTYTVYMDTDADFTAPDSLCTTNTSIYSEFCQPGYLYYWQVKATDLSGQATFSPLARFYTALAAKPRAPVDFCLTVQGADLQISWESVPGADNYLLFHSLLPDAGFEQLSSGSQSSYLHTGAALQLRGFYKVVAEDYLRKK